MLVCLGLVVAIFLVSCSPNSSSISPQTTKSTSAGVTAPTDIVQAEWQQTLIEARKEGKVVVFGAYGIAMARDPLIKAFNEKFGIPLEMTIGLPTDLTAKLVNQRNAGLYTADVYMIGGSSVINDLRPRNMLQPIMPYLILPEVKDPSQWFRGALPFWENQKITLATLSNNPPGEMAINTNFLKASEVTHYEDLLDPKLKGLLIMADPTVPGGGMSWFHIAWKLHGEDYLKGLVKQDTVITRDFRLMTDWLARGKSAMGIGADQATVMSAKRDGAPVAVLAPLEGGEAIGLGGGVVSVLDKNPHPNATKIFVNWMLSKDAQYILSKATGMSSRRLDVPTDHLIPWQVLNPNKKYIMQDEAYTVEENTMREIAQRVFAPLLK